MGTREYTTMNWSQDNLKTIVDFIVNWEAGDEAYYNKFCIHPSYPEGDSGVTLGVGYDCGYADTESFAPWYKYLGNENGDRLAQYLGITGIRCKAICETLQDISISYQDAISFFTDNDLPKAFKETLGAFGDAFLKLPDLSQGALVSLIFNRGTSMNGDRRLEMRQIQSSVQNGQLDDVPDYLRQMKRLWANVKGLRDRRDAEANLFQKGLDSVS